MLFFVLNQVLKILSVQSTLLDLMKFLMILRDFMYSWENTYYILILTQQFQLLSVLCEISILHAMFVRLIFA
jgi:hypothetical protein